jgi:hypothetical protein
MLELVKTNFSNKFNIYYIIYMDLHKVIKNSYAKKKDQKNAFKDKGYVYDGSFRCNTKPLSLPLGVNRDQCPSDFKYDGVSTCWSKCSSNEVDKGVTCESCPSNMTNNGASLCYSPCDTGYTNQAGICWSNKDSVPLGVAPNVCEDGYNLFGGYCYNKTCYTGYVYDVMMTCNRVDKKIGTATPVSVTCPTGYTKVGLYCYADCDANYTFDNTPPLIVQSLPSPEKSEGKC